MPLLRLGLWRKRKASFSVEMHDLQISIFGSLDTEFRSDAYAAFPM